MPFRVTPLREERPHCGKDRAGGSGLAAPGDSAPRGAATLRPGPGRDLQGEVQRVTPLREERPQCGEAYNWIVRERHTVTPLREERPHCGGQPRRCLHTRSGVTPLREER